jgi:5-methylthioadenosine/S-adenosylhomocysteine deaminase
LFGGNVVEDLFFRLEQGLGPDDIRAFARLGAYENLLSGVGLVWDHYYGGLATAEALRDTGLAGVVAPTLQDLDGPGSDNWESELDATARLAEDESFAAAGVFAALGPHATDTVSKSLWQKACELATHHSLPIHAHVAQSFEEYERSWKQNQRSPIAELGRTGVLAEAPRLLMVHALFVSDRDLTELDPQKHVLGFCPSSQQRFGFPADLPRWQRAGIPWVLGTDCAPCNDSMNVQKELRLAAGMQSLRITHSHAYGAFRTNGTLEDAARVDARRRELAAASEATESALELLASVWSVPGSLHPGVRCGALRSGNLANLVVYDPGHPAFWPATDPLRTLAYCDTSGAIEWMLVAGRPIGERGRFHESIVASDSYRAALEEATGRLQALLERIGATKSWRTGGSPIRH